MTDTLVTVSHLTEGTAEVTEEVAKVLDISPELGWARDSASKISALQAERDALAERIAELEAEAAQAEPKPSGRRGSKTEAEAAQAEPKPEPTGSDTTKEG